MWVTSRPRIAKNYLETWFLIDLIGVIPFDLFTRPSLEESERPDLMAYNSRVDNEEDLSILRVARILKLLRLAKLLRVLRASRIISRWQNFVGLSFAQMTMIRFLMATVLMIHFMYATCGFPLRLP